MTDSLKEDSLPVEGRLAGIDFGTRRVGIAVCDASQQLASPLDVYQRRNEPEDAAYFQQLVSDQALVGLAFGVLRWQLIRNRTGCFGCLGSSVWAWPIALLGGIIWAARAI